MATSAAEDLADQTGAPGSGGQDAAGGVVADDQVSVAEVGRDGGLG